MAYEVCDGFYHICGFKFIKGKSVWLKYCYVYYDGNKKFLFLKKISAKR